MWLQQTLRATMPGIILGALMLLVPAGLLPGGTWLWPQGIAFVTVSGAIQLAGNAALAIWRPAHLKVRQQSVVAPRARKQPLIDAVGSAGLLVFAAAWLAFVPLDVFRLHLLPPPGPIASILAGLAAILGAALTPLAVWENRFATPNVQDQSADAQRVVDSGVYSVIRHPIYLANFLLFGGGAIWMGSYAAVIGLGVLALGTVQRIVIEENHLFANVPGYADYARRVRSRLIPFVL